MRRLSTFSTEPGAAEGRCRSSERLAHAIQRFRGVRRRVHERVVKGHERNAAIISRNVNRYLWCCDGTIHQRQEHFAGAVRRHELLGSLPQAS